ncbi:DUF6701 domain-containing protein [Enterovibrio calviensis]|uniref:DUF6701 domain-containing protein n=1 Tax=Enterovibrio calviensis TaxID=91359 RepID=UPI003736FAEA
MKKSVIRNLLLLFIMYFLPQSVSANTFSEDICQTFPGPAQTHINTYTGRINGTLWINATGQIQGAKDFKVGFLGINVGSGTQIGPNTCEYLGETGYCGIDKALIAPPPSMPDFQDVTEDLDIYAWNYNDVTDNGYLRNKKYRNVTFNGVKVKLRTGEYWINSLTTTAANGPDNQPISSEIIIEAEQPVVLHIRNMTLNGGAKFNNSGSADNLSIVGHDGNSTIKLQAESAFKALVYNQGNVTLSGSTTLIGGVTADHIRVEGNSKIIGESRCFSAKKYKLDISPDAASASGCTRIPLTFSVQDANGVVQADITGKLSVGATSNNDHICWAVTGEPNARCMPNSLSNITVVDGEAKLWLGGIGDEIYIKGSFTPNDIAIEKLEQVAGPYDFAPLGFRVRGGAILKMVAGKPDTVTLEAVKALGNGQVCKVDSKYEGVKQLAFSNQHLNPASGSWYPDINGYEITTNTPLDLEFNSGETNFSLAYLDAGQLSIDVVERMKGAIEANTSQQDPLHSPLENAQPPKGGQILVDVRPYTLAICDVKAQDKGQSKAADAFTYAGAPFSANLKPVIWQTGDKTDSSLIDLSKKEYCSRLSTPSFWHPDAPDARVTINNTAQVVTPTGGASASVSGATNQNHTEAINGRYEYPSLSLNNVGTFKLRSRVVDSYLGMTVNRADLPVGRFYPSHFMVTPEFESGVSRSHDSLHQGFTYLGQPFSGVYTINAATTFDTPVSNYHLRSDKAVFDGWVIDPVSGYPYAGTDLTTRWAFTPDPSVGQQGQWKAGENGESEWVIDGQMSIVKDAVPESPFTPLRFAVGAISFDQDNTDFVYCADASKSECEMRVIKPQGDGNPSLSGVQIATDDFYFGRMRIEGFTDTKTPFSEQTLPVAVEVFNGTHFVTNTRDNATIVSTEIGKKDVLFSDKANNAALQAQVLLRDNAKNVVTTKNVKEGRADFYVIAPDQSSGLNREQFRYWQQLDMAVSGVVPQTWLQHNWQGTQFDDDPSGIGIFGFYRGSDRVIYKGEKNITLTEE